MGRERDKRKVVDEEERNELLSVICAEELETLNTTDIRETF